LSRVFSIISNFIGKIRLLAVEKKAMEQESWPIPRPRERHPDIDFEGKRERLARLGDPGAGKDFAHDDVLILAHPGESG